MLHSKKNDGFTLLELMIVLVILSILGAIITPQFMDEPHKSCAGTNAN